MPLEVLRHREAKWLDMLNHWDRWVSKRFKKVGAAIDIHYILQSVVFIFTACSQEQFNNVRCLPVPYMYTLEIKREGTQLWKYEEIISVWGLGALNDHCYLLFYFPSSRVSLYWLAQTVPLLLGLIRNLSRMSPWHNRFNKALSGQALHRISSPYMVFSDVFIY